MSKHLVIIHGRDKKPECEKLLGLIKKALVAGLRRVDEDAANQLDKGELPITLAYYGDINNRLLLARRPKLKSIMHQVNGNWYVEDDYYDEDLQRLMERPLTQFDRKHYDEHMRDHKLIGLQDDIAQAVSPLFSLFELSNRIIRSVLPDLGAYLNSRVVGSEIRERLQEPLAKALHQYDDVMLISHSMGCMVAYDVLWKFSRMSEYKHLWDKRVNVWLTIGNPLGEPFVSKGLYDSDEPFDGKFPRNIKKWINVNAVDDYIAHDTTIADDFSPMMKEGLIEHIKDEPTIYNFWKDHNGRCNPHNLFGYLNHPDVSAHIAKWITSS